MSLVGCSGTHRSRDCTLLLERSAYIGVQIALAAHQQQPAGEDSTSAVTMSNGAHLHCPCRGVF